MKAGASSARKKPMVQDVTCATSQESTDREQQLGLLEEIQPVDVAFVKREMEAIYGTRLSDHDPAIRNVQLIDIAVQQAFRNACTVVAGYMDRKAADFVRSLDESTLKRQAESRSDVLRFAEQLRQAFRRDETAAIKELMKCSEQIRKSVEKMQTTRAQRQWLHYVLLMVIGVVLSCGFVLAGYVLGKN